MLNWKYVFQIRKNWYLDISNFKDGAKIRVIQNLSKFSNLTSENSTYES